MRMAAISRLPVNDSHDKVAAIGFNDIPNTPSVSDSPSLRPGVVCVNRKFGRVFPG